MGRFKMKTVADVLHWEPYLEDAQVAALKDVACPARIGGKEAPQSLDDITLGQLIQLEEIGREKGVFEAIAVALLGRPAGWAMTAPALPMLGLRNMVVAEQNRIAALFASLAREHDPAELAAGVESLNFGIFGLADWYAQRMHITSHDEVFATPWIRIWQCRKNDADEAEYRKRLDKIRHDLARQRQ